MKTYSDKHLCDNCRKEFTWIYKDDGHRPWKRGMYTSEVISYGTDEEIKNKKLAICSRKIKIPAQLEYFCTTCPHCHFSISFECTDGILKDLYS